MKYFGEYVLGWSGASNMKADKGTMVHKVLEVLACCKKAQQDGESHYKDSEFLGDVEVPENLFMINLEELTEKVYDHYSTANYHHNWQPKDYREVRRWVYKAIELQDGLYDPRNRNVVEAEPHFDIEIPHDWALYEFEMPNGETVKGRLSIKGTVDLVTELSPEVLEVTDWKTGGRINWATGEEYTYEKLRENHQLRMYHYAMTVLYPQYEDIIMNIVYINKGGPFSIHYTRADIPETMERLHIKFDRIKNSQIPLDISDKDYSATPWKKPCNFCGLGNSTFENTNVEPIRETRPGQITPVGQYMSKCEQLRYCFKYREMNSVAKNMTKEGHDVAHYRSPGSTD
jgi:hypothetical protein